VSLVCGRMILTSDIDFRSTLKYSAFQLDSRKRCVSNALELWNLESLGIPDRMAYDGHQDRLPFLVQYRSRGTLHGELLDEDGMIPYNCYC